MRRPTPKGFSLIEVMVAVALSAVVIGGAVGAFHDSLVEQAASKHKWVAFSIGQQQMEMLASIARDAAPLAQNVVSAVGAGTSADAVCDMAVGPQHFKVNDLGVPSATGTYELCWRVTDGSPSGDLKNVRVVVLFPVLNGSGHVILQTIR